MRDQWSQKMNEVRRWGRELSAVFWESLGESREREVCSVCVYAELNTGFSLHRTLHWSVTSANMVQNFHVTTLEVQTEKRLILKCFLPSSSFFRVLLHTHRHLSFYIFMLLMCCINFLASSRCYGSPRVSVCASVLAQLCVCWVRKRTQ